MSIKNKDDWRKLLAKAESGDKDAQYKVGLFFVTGIKNKREKVIVRASPEQAIYWYKLAAEQGDESAQLALGNLLSNPEVVEPDTKAAMYWTKQAIRQGSAVAAHNLGAIYRDIGKPGRAFRWYRRAARMQYGFGSLLEVGFCYLFGFGTKQNIQAAYECFEKIASDTIVVCERDKENASYWLAILNLLGIDGISSNIEKARNLLEFADRDSDHEQANELLNIIGKSKNRLTV